MPTWTGNPWDKAPNPSIFGFSEVETQKSWLYEIHINSQDFIWFYHLSNLSPWSLFRNPMAIPQAPSDHTQSYASPTGAPTVIGSPAGCPPDRYQWTHPWLWEHGLWPWLHLRLPWTKKFMGNHGIWITFEKGYYDMIHMMGIFFLIASKIIKDYGFQWRCSLKLPLSANCGIWDDHILVATGYPFNGISIQWDTAFKELAQWYKMI